MNTSPAGRAIQRLHSGVLARAEEMTDSVLLESFVSSQDEAAFEALVLRHGPMVLAVCRRILGHSHDAEDAFQAVFLVLVRKAASVVPRELVANWLYGVAFRTANKARVMNATRRAKEMKVRERPTPEEAHAEFFWRDLLPVLDRELQALPDKYRAAIVLCDLEGKQRKDAARQLGWPEGTLSSRLATGRRMLARRLGRRGVALYAGAVALMLVNAAGAAVPLPLVATTVQAGLLAAAGQGLVGAGVSATVAALADGVVKAMLLAKLKVVAAVLLALAVASGGVGLYVERGTLASRSNEAASPQPSVVEPASQSVASVTATESAPNPARPQCDRHQADVKVTQVWVLHGEEFAVTGRCDGRATPSAASASHHIPGIAIRTALGGSSESDCIVDFGDIGFVPRGPPSHSVVLAGNCAAPPAAPQGAVVWKIVVVQGYYGNPGTDGGFVTVGHSTIWIRAVPIKGTILRL